MASPPIPPRPVLLAPLGALYGAVTRARLALYRRGVLTSQRLAAPVISVGNITTGGTGKTPLVEWVARAASREGRNICILTRGYGRENPHERVVVSDGESILADARRAGDEPRLLAEMLQGVAAVISDADRVAAARWALENLGSEVFILDDGFQHLRLARDLNIVTLDGTDPWGGERLLPRGRLREPLAGLARADCIVITRADMAADLDAIRARAEHLSGGRAVVLAARAHTQGAQPLESPKKTGVSSVKSITTAPPQPVAAFCAIGNPTAFFAHLRRDGHTVCYERAFSDHHYYTQRDADMLSREAAVRGALSLVTTAKDAVKLRSLRFALPCYTIEIALDFEDEDRLLALIHKTVARARSAL